MKLELNFSPAQGGLGKLPGPFSRELLKLSSRFIREALPKTKKVKNSCCCHLINLLSEGHWTARCINHRVGLHKTASKTAPIAPATPMPQKERTPVVYTFIWHLWLPTLLICLLVCLPKLIEVLFRLGATPSHMPLIDIGSGHCSLPNQHPPLPPFPNKTLTLFR